ncbi:MAG: hypothetical protein ABIQ61_06955 [Ornithinibacter sp.]
MDETFAAYLEQVRAHRSELGEAMRALDEATSLPVGRGQLWRRRVRAALTELAHDLRDHVALTEAEGGLYADIGVTSPRLTHAVEQQRQDHRWFLEEVERLLTERDEGLTDEGALAAHREAATSLVGRLVRHRQRGSDLIYEAYAVDIGGSD